MEPCDLEKLPNDTDHLKEIIDFIAGWPEPANGRTVRSGFGLGCGENIGESGCRVLDLGHMKKFVGVILLCVAGWAAMAQAGRGLQACRYPVRVFGPRTAVNLNPLFAWWNRQPGPTNGTGYAAATIDVSSNSPADDTDRPLPAWHLVTGAPVGNVNGGGWAVEAVIYTSPSARTNARIILVHPPTGEQESYLTLKADLVQVDQQIQSAQRAYAANTNEEMRAEARAELYRRSISKVASTGVLVNSREAEQRHAAAAADLRQKDELLATRTAIQTRLKAIPVVSGAYHIEWFAMMTGRTKQGVPVYDPGVVPTQ
jgi:hypothetical protein